MHRLTARLLLLFALVGTLAPAVLAVAAPPPRACCLRKGVHRCHGLLGHGSLAAETGELAIRDAGCCKGDCYRAVTTAQWAHPQPKLAVIFLQTIAACVAASQPGSSAAASVRFHSTRAPPAC